MGFGFKRELLDWGESSYTCWRQVYYKIRTFKGQYYRSNSGISRWNLIGLKFRTQEGQHRIRPETAIYWLRGCIGYHNLMQCGMC
jgi:hypothetical protein